MAWDKKYTDFGVLIVEGKNTKVHSSNGSFTTVNAGEEVDRANWSNGYLNIHLSSGKVRRYSGPGSFTTI